MHARTLELVAPYCDLSERLRAVPADASVRGVMFRCTTNKLRSEGKLEAFQEQFGNVHHDSLAFYPLSDHLLHMAAGAAVLLSPERVMEGVGLIARDNARELSSSLLGQTLLHALASDPLSLLEQGLAMRRQTRNYGRWDLLRHGPRDVEVQYTDEYVWIEQSHHHAAMGTFDACSIKPRITTVLTGPYSGSTRFQW